MKVVWNKYDGLVLVAFVGVVIYHSAAIFMPKIEGRFFPVVSPATLYSFTPQPPPAWRAKWNATAEKHRECSYVLGSIDWRFGKYGKVSQQVFARFDDKPQNRSKGVLEWNSLIVDLDPDIVPTESFATVLHQCPWRWWQTESIFYLPK